ncbi:hypothetical protein BJ085DRAFT_29689 [Dimargaris cristalligena]|uniref:RRM domain-containing protein n=1 Tax=Dimargaris cristalligena TaxID=215637 RepID=A0A4P9ZQJ9_9FUNG|nr:hypothetical protein BJ085DRAFT_29689 [Dimargaris cristalligena]|eukprot:RKP35011.1 hypothetical protein BJ085DRAFT_29689 [Dimargaris cristalligena]
MSARFPALKLRRLPAVLGHTGFRRIPVHPLGQPLVPQRQFSGYPHTGAPKKFRPALSPFDVNARDHTTGPPVSQRRPTKIRFNPKELTNTWDPAIHHDNPNDGLNSEFGLDESHLPSRFIIVQNVPPTMIPADFRAIAQRSGMLPEQIVDVYPRYDSNSILTSQVVVEFATRSAASSFLIKNGQHSVTGQVLNMNFLRPSFINNASGRCVLALGFPKQVTDSEVHQFFSGYEIVESSNAGVIRLPMNPPRIVASRFVIHLSGNREAERVVRETNNKFFTPTTSTGFHPIKTSILY